MFVIHISVWELLFSWISPLLCAFCYVPFAKEGIFSFLQLLSYLFSHSVITPSQSIWIFSLTSWILWHFSSYNIVFVSSWLIYIFIWKSSNFFRLSTFAIIINDPFTWKKSPNLRAASKYFLESFCSTFPVTSLNSGISWVLIFSNPRSYLMMWCFYKIL